MNIDKRLGKRTEEIKKKMSESRKKLYASGFIPPMLGKRHSKESINRMRLAHMGKPSWNKGKRLSNETIEKIRIAKLKYHYNRGKHLSEETRKKISQSLKGRKGRALSEEAKKKIGDASKKRRPFQIFPFKDTSIELALQNALKERSISFTTHKPITGQPDIFIEPNICIFADGCYWHGCEQCYDRNKMVGWAKARKIKDLLVTQKLINDGYVVLRFWEHEIKKNVDLCILQIKEMIKCDTK